MLIVRTLAGFAFLLAVVATAFFGAAGTLHDGRGWTMLAVFFGCSGLITVWLWFRDKALLERRVKAGPGAEPDPMQNIVQALAGIAFLATFLVPGLDRRFGRSVVAPAASLAGDMMIALGFLIVFLTFRENTFTAGTIEVADGRWGWVPAGLLVPVIVWRLIREEVFLAANLTGYRDYLGQVRYRLAPLIW